MFDKVVLSLGGFKMDMRDNRRSLEWTQEDWNIREELRKSNTMQELFHVYWQNRQYILENRPELAKFTLRVFWNKFCRVPDFRYLIWANEATYGLPDSDPIRSTIKHTFLNQIKINY